MYVNVSMRGDEAYSFLSKTTKGLSFSGSDSYRVSREPGQHPSSVQPRRALLADRLSAGDGEARSWPVLLAAWLGRAVELDWPVCPLLQRRHQGHHRGDLRVGRWERL